MRSAITRWSEERASLLSLLDCGAGEPEGCLGLLLPPWRPCEVDWEAFLCPPRCPPDCDLPRCLPSPLLLFFADSEPERNARHVDGGPAEGLGETIEPLKDALASNLGGTPASGLKLREAAGILAGAGAVDERARACGSSLVGAILLAKSDLTSNLGVVDVFDLGR